MENKKATLREFITELEKLTENGKYDDVPVCIDDMDDNARPIAWYGIDDCYPLEELEENNPQHPTKILLIQYS